MPAFRARIAPGDIYIPRLERMDGEGREYAGDYESDHCVGGVSLGIHGFIVYLVIA